MQYNDLTDKCNGYIAYKLNQLKAEDFEKEGISGENDTDQEKKYIKQLEDKYLFNKE